MQSMDRWMTAVALICAVVVPVVDVAAQDNAQAAYARVREQMNTIEDRTQRFELCREFLVAYGNSPQARDMFRLVIYLADDPGHAAATLEELGTTISEPGNQLTLKQSLLSAYGQAGNTEKVTILSAELSASGAVDFALAALIAEAADKAKLHELSESSARQALSLLDTEGMTKRYGERTGRIVIGRMVAENWMRICRARLAAADALGALEAIGQARNARPANFLGISDNDYGYYTGLALRAQGDIPAAIDAFAVEALFDHHELSLEALRELHASHMNDVDFETFLQQRRLALARPAPEFTLERLVGEGGPMSLSSLRGKVVLINFWSYG